MKNLTLIIPAKKEKESLSKVLDELEPYNFQKIILQFGHYKYLKNTQNNKSIENYIERNHNKKYYRLVKKLGILFNVIKSVPLVLKNYNAIYGYSQIVHLVKR